MDEKKARGAVRQRAADQVPVVERDRSCAARPVEGGNVLSALVVEGEDERFVARASEEGDRLAQDAAAWPEVETGDEACDIARALRR